MTINKRFKQIRQQTGLTQTEFAEKIGSTRDAVSNIELGRVAPTPMVKKLVCREFGINEYWLETGDGEMFRTVSRDEEVTEFFMSVLAGDDSFKKAFVSALSQVDDNGWKLIKDFAEKLYEEQKKDRG